MQISQFISDSASYKIYRNEKNPGKPFCLFLHGGPGFHSQAEREVLGGPFNEELNFLWFDLLGCADSPAKSLDCITWNNQIQDLRAIIQKFANGPVNIIGHCLGAQITHDLIRLDRSLVKRVVWYSPVQSVLDVFHRVLQRALAEKRLERSSLTADEVRGLDSFLKLGESDLTGQETMLLLQLAAKTRDFDSLYWFDQNALKRWLNWMNRWPLKPEVFLRLMSDYFSRGPLPVPDYSGVPVLMLHSDNDVITPWEKHGKKLSSIIPQSERRLVPDGCHWLQFEKPEETIRHTLDFLKDA